METVTLLYNWNYRVAGKHYKRNYEYPFELKGRSMGTYTIDPVKPFKEQLLEIKQQIKEDLSKSYKARAIRDFEHSEYEEIDSEEFQIYNIREADRWSEIEDFSYSK
jgi:hypothetical protein